MNGHMRIYSHVHLKGLQKLTYVILTASLLMIFSIGTLAALGTETASQPESSIEKPAYRSISRPASPGARHAPRTAGLNRVVSLPADRTADDYLIIDTDSISPAIRSTLRLTQSFSVAFWFSYTEKMLLNNQRTDTEVGQFLTAGEGLKLKFRAPDADRSIHLVLSFWKGGSQYWNVETFGDANGRRRTVLPNEWVHIAFVYDASQHQLRFYYNGRFAVMETAEAGAHPVFDVEALEISNPCCIPSNYEGTLAFAMDDLIIYRRALQDTEVVQLYSEPPPLRQDLEAQQAVAYWSFETQPGGQFDDEISGLRLVSHAGQNDTLIQSKTAVIPRFPYDPPPYRIYVVDREGHRIQYFGLSGDFLGTWGSPGSGDGEFQNPTSAAVAPDGTVYVADTGNHRIQYFSATGEFLGKWGSQGNGDGQFQSPAGVAVAPDGTVYVADTGNHRIQYFSATGEFLGKWGSQGSADGEFQSPAGVGVAIVERTISTNTVALTDTVYVADTGNHRIQYFSGTGEFAGKWGSKNGDSCENYQFCSPSDIAVTPTGIVYVADTEHNRIQRFGITGTFVVQWNSPYPDRQDDSFQSPAGVAVGPNGLVYVADTGNNRIQYFKVSGSSVVFQNQLDWPDDADEQFLEPTGVAVSNNMPYAYYPQTEEEETLLNYILTLAGCDPLPLDRAGRARTLNCNNTSAFEVPIQPVTTTIITRALILDRGEYGGFYTAEALGYLSDVLRVPAALYTQFYDPCYLTRHVEEECDPGLWRVAAGPATVALMATFYDLRATWNPYGPGAGRDVRIPLRNRIVLNALVDLLFSMERLVSTGHQAQWLYNPGFRLNYSAYTCQKVCPHLRDQAVARAWYAALKRGLNFLFANSRGYPLSDNDPYPAHENTGTGESDMVILGLQFANHMLPLADRYGTQEDIEHIREIRDEWTRLLVDMKSRSEAEFQESTYEDGEAKGFLTSGRCLMDRTIVASYQGECENFTGELYAAAVAEEDLSYARRIMDTLRQAAELAYDLSLVDHRFPGLNGYTSDQSVSGRADKPSPFPQRGLRIQRYLLGRVSPRYASFLWPQVWQDLLNHLPENAMSFDELVQEGFDTLGGKMQFHLVNASDPVTGERHYPTAMKLDLRPSRYAQNMWGNWWEANVVEHMVNPPRAGIIQGDPNLILYPVQKTTRRFLSRALGEPGQEDFFVVDQRDPRTGFGYYATFYTGVSFRQQGFNHKGAGGSGMGALAVAVPPPEDAIMPGRRAAVPIKGGYLGRFSRTMADGRCVRPGQPWNVAIETTPQNKPQCAYLFMAGRYDWREWPASAVWAVRPNQMIELETVAPGVYSSVYYNTAEAQMSEPLSTTVVLSTATPISYTYGFRSGANWRDAFGCQDGGPGGCVHRRYIFYPNRMLVETRVTGADRDPYLDTAVVFETVPVYFGFQYQTSSPSAPERQDLEAHFGRVVHFRGLNGEKLAADRDGRIVGVTRILIYQDVEDLTFREEGAPPDPEGAQGRLAGVEIRFTGPDGRPRTTTVWTNTLSVFGGVMGQGLWKFYRNLLVEIPRNVQGDEFALSYELTPYREDQACAALRGDVDCSCTVDAADLQRLAGRWRQPAEPPYDLDWDGDVDIVDIMQVVPRWGERCLVRAP